MTSVEIRDRLLELPDTNGWCNLCHANSVAVWIDRDSTDAEQRQLCGPCWPRQATYQERRRPTHPTVPQRQKQLLTGMDYARGQRELFSTYGSR